MLTRWFIKANHVSSIHHRFSKIIIFEGLPQSYKDAKVNGAPVKPIKGTLSFSSVSNLIVSNTYGTSFF